MSLTIELSSRGLLLYCLCKYMMQMHMMTVSHSTFLEYFYDIFEFTSKLKQQEKQKNKRF